jgi:hypothetical protein
MEKYRAHPVHQRFLAWLIEHECTPLAFDYYLGSGTVLMPEENGADALSQTPETDRR